MGQGVDALEVLERFSSSMNYKGRITPRGSQNPSPRIERDIQKKFQINKTSMILPVWGQYRAL
eukprot:1564196-Prorocentrum_lima.AAC.1